MIAKLMALFLQSDLRLVEKWLNGGPPEVGSTPLSLSKKVGCGALMSSVNHTTGQIGGSRKLVPGTIVPGAPYLVLRVPGIDTIYSEYQVLGVLLRVPGTIDCRPGTRYLLEYQVLGVSGTPINCTRYQVYGVRSYVRTIVHWFSMWECLLNHLKTSFASVPGSPVAQRPLLKTKSRD